MTRVIAGMTMSLDGFVNDRHGSVVTLYPDIMPVLLGGGLRLFEGTSVGPVQLERIRVLELPGGRTHLEFRIIK